MLKRMAKTVLNVLLFLCIFIVSYLTIIRGLFPENVNAQTIDITKFGDISNYSSAEIHKVLDDILKENNIPPTIIDEVIESGESEEIINDYVNDIITNASTGKELPSIPKEKIETALTKGINKYNQKYNANISVDKVKNMVESFANKLEDTLSVLYQGMSFLEYFQIFFNNTIYYTILIFMLLLITLMAFLYKKEFLFSLGGITLFNSIVLLLTYFLVKSEKLASVLSFIPIELKKIQNSFLTSGMIFLITGILLLIMYKVICIWEEKRKQHR